MKDSIVPTIQEFLQAATFPFKNGVIQPNRMSRMNADGSTIHANQVDDPGSAGWNK